MGYKNDCRKALVVGSKVTVNFGVHEFTGKVISYDNKNSNDYSLMLELEKNKERVIFPLSGGDVAITFKPTKDLIDYEKEQKEISKKEQVGVVPK